VNKLNALPKHSFKNVFPNDEVLKDTLQLGRPFVEYSNCPLFEIGCKFTDLEEDDDSEEDYDGETHKFCYKGEINSNK